MTTIIDTNILLDIWLRNPGLAERSAAALADAIEEGDVAINAIIYTEVSPSFTTKEDLDEEIAGLGIEVLPLTNDVAFLAGSAYREYRRQGGPRTSLLADFFIGAHAAVAGYQILTRDARRYRTYFPRVPIIEP